MKQIYGFKNGVLVMMGYYSHYSKDFTAMELKEKGEIINAPTYDKLASEMKQFGCDFVGHSQER